MTTLAELGAEPYVSLTTFRRSGEPVATAVWVAAAGSALVVRTEATTGKVKRIRHTPEVVLRPCSRSGRTAADAPDVHARAEIVTDPAEIDRLSRPLRAKYGLLASGFYLVERLLRRRRVLLRLTALPD